MIWDQEGCRNRVGTRVFWLDVLTQDVRTLMFLVCLLEMLNLGYKMGSRGMSGPARRFPMKLPDFDWMWMTGLGRGGQPGRQLEWQARVPHIVIRVVLHRSSRQRTDCASRKWTGPLRQRPTDRPGAGLSNPRPTHRKKSYISQTCRSNINKSNEFGRTFRFRR